MVYTHNGIFTKINKYYDAITYGLLEIMHSNDLRLLFSAKVKILTLSGFTECKDMDLLFNIILVALKHSNCQSA